MYETECTMKKKKQNYSQLHYEQELAAQKRRSKKHPEPVPEIIPGKEDPQTGILFFLRRILFPNLTDLLLNNLLFFLTVLPLLLLTELTLHTGGLIFLAGAWLFSPIAAAGMAALYHRCCEYTRRIAPSVRIAFVSFFIHNLKASILPGLISGFSWILCGIYIIGGNRQKSTSTLLYYLLIVLILFLVSCYTTMLLLQVALFRLPVKAVLKNAVLLIPSCGFRCIIPALLQLGFILILSSNLWLGLLFFFLGIPGIISTITTHLLWPRLQQILLKEE